MQSQHLDREGRLVGQVAGVAGARCAERHPHRDEHVPVRVVHRQRAEPALQHPSQRATRAGLVQGHDLQIRVRSARQVGHSMDLDVAGILRRHAVQRVVPARCGHDAPPVRARRQGPVVLQRRSDDRVSRRAARGPALWEEELLHDPGSRVVVQVQEVEQVVEAAEAAGLGRPLELEPRAPDRRAVPRAAERHRDAVGEDAAAAVEERGHEDVVVDARPLFRARDRGAEVARHRGLGTGHGLGELGSADETVVAGMAQESGYAIGELRKSRHPRRERSMMRFEALQKVIRGDPVLAFTPRHLQPFLNRACFRG